MENFAPSVTDKQLVEQVKTVLTATYVLYLHQLPCNSHLLWDEVSALLEHYPEFAQVDKTEQGYLLAFRNYLALALTFVPAKNNKIFLLKVIERLEGSNNEYVTGSGQKAEVTRRVSIYEIEGNVKAKRKTGEGNDKNSTKKSCKDTLQQPATAFFELPQVASVPVSEASSASSTFSVPNLSMAFATNPVPFPTSPIINFSDASLDSLIDSLSDGLPYEEMMTSNWEDWKLNDWKLFDISSNLTDEILADLAELAELDNTQTTAELA
eukprot:scaffold19_cov172-Ochromonas_danica.AAC.2